MMNIKQSPTTKFQKNLATLPVSIIRVDDYQRVLRESNVKKIVSGFDPIGLQHLSISFRDGEYYVFDGQHRLEALKRLGIEEVECIIHYGMSYEDEAKAWDYFNKQITVASRLDEANAALKRGELLEVGIDEAVREVGLEIDYKKVGVSGRVRAYSALEQVYKKEGKERLQKVLLFIRRNLGVGRKELSGWYIKGINAFLNEFQNHPNFDIDWLEKRVVSEGFQVIDHNVRAMQSMFKKGYEQSVVAVLKETYNKGKAYENRI